MDRVPDKLWQRLMNFQRDGVKFAVEKDGKCLIADEMGLGKTLQAISVASVYREEWPLLIIVPSSLKFSWIEEIEKWLPDVLPGHINLIHCGTDASGISDSPISIISYGLLRLPSSVVVRTAITACGFKVIICDESHYLKNTKSLSTKVIVPIIKSAKRKILLSGTPALAKPVELYPQIDAICPGKFGSFLQFTERYCDAHMVFYGRQRRIRKVDGASNLEELQKKMHSLLMIRREKSEVLTELPPKQRQRIVFDLKESAQKKEIFHRFNQLRENIAQGKTFFQLLADKESYNANATFPNDDPKDDNVDEGEENEVESESTSVFREVSTLYKLSGEAKIGPVRDYIEMLCENDKLKFLVFAYHHSMMDGIQQTLHDKNVKFVRIDGHTKGFERQICVNSFQSDNSIRVAILSILAAGVGLTLTAAKLVVFAELYWTPGVMVQCEDRAHRIGQVDSLPVHYLVAKNTMDDWVWSAVCRKTHVTSTALTGKCKNLEHEEGDSYQVDVLSNADMWVANQEQETVDVSELIKSQRAPDQPSILNFLSPSKNETKIVNTQDPRTKTKQTFTTLHKASNFPSSSSHGGKISNRENRIEKNLEEVIVIDSDDEEIFKPPPMKKKKTKYDKKQSNSVNRKGDKDVSHHKKSREAIASDVSESSENQTKNSRLHEVLSLPGLNRNTSKEEHNTMDCANCDSELVTKVDHESLGSTPFFECSSSFDNQENIVKPITTQIQKKKAEMSLIQETKVFLSASRVTIHNSAPPMSDAKRASDLNLLCPSENGKTPERKKGQWPCSLCTFINHADLPLCEMCESPKKNSCRTTASERTVLSKSDGSNSPLLDDSNYQDPICDFPKGSAKTNYDTTDALSTQTYPSPKHEKDMVEGEFKHESFQSGSKDYSHNRALPSVSSDLSNQTQHVNGEQINGNQNCSGISVVEDSSEPSSCFGLEKVHSPGGSTTLPLHNNDDGPSEQTENYHKVLNFSCSVHTGRIFVYNENGLSLQANFLPIDIEMGNISELPNLLQQPHHLKLIQRFVREWASLRDTKKKLIAKRGIVFVHPILASEEVKSVQGITQRHMTKTDLGTAIKKARGKHGSVRLISHPNHAVSNEPSTSSVNKGVNQVIDSEGVPLCLQCEKPYTNSLLPKEMISASENAWLVRLCSYTCMDKYWTLNHASYCREKIYDVERGICQLCKFNAHEFYDRMKVMKDVKKRAEILRKSPFHKLCGSLREKMVLQPSPGQFWHVDHITPVWQGGGMCDLDNLRTLCTPCHSKVTSRQAGQRAVARKLSNAASCGDISAFFQR